MSDPSPPPPLTEFRGFVLDRFQAEAITALQSGVSVLVCAPTGTGKTLIADWVVERALAAGRDVIYTAPIKALSNQKFRDWTRRYGDERVGLLTGDLVIRRDAPCRVMTTEILRNMLLTGEPLPELDAVIVDEIHFLDDRERGTVWEELLIYLPQRVQIVGLSATLANAKAFADWIGQVRGRPVAVVREDKRAVPLEFWVGNLETGLIRPRDFDQAAQRWAKRQPARPQRGGRFRGRGRRNHDEPQTTHSDIFDIVREADLLPCLYFAFSRKATEQYARALARRLTGGGRHRGTRSLLDAHEQRRVEARLDAAAAEDPKLLDDDLRTLYESGIAFHHAGLNVKLKALVEELYEERLIKVLYCTSTFALGINMPARTTIFDGLKKFDGISLRPLTTREFMQKAGRAGRRGMDDVGHVVLRCDFDEWEEVAAPFARCLRGEPEPVRSSFSLSFNSVVNLLHHNPPERIREIVEKSFLNYSRQKEAKAWSEDAAQRAERVASGEATRKERRYAERLAEKAKEREDLTWLEFQSRVEFLVRIGYLGKDRSFNAGAEVLRRIQIEEIFVTELVLDGVFEGLGPETTFGVLCALNKELGRDVVCRARLKGEAAEAARRATRIRGSAAVRDAEELSGVSATWYPDLIPYGAMWVQGKSLEELMDSIQSLTDVSGDLVGAFRRAKDLAGQLKEVYADDPGRRELFAELIRTVSRDEVMVVD